MSHEHSKHREAKPGVKMVRSFSIARSATPESRWKRGFGRASRTDCFLHEHVSRTCGTKLFRVCACMDDERGRHSCVDFD